MRTPLNGALNWNVPSTGGVSISAESFAYRVTTTGRDLQAGELVLASVKALGGSNGAAGNGGNVSVSHAGSIVTTGGQAHGIVAQSVVTKGISLSFISVSPGAVAKL